jgi:hypothetical protein
MNEIGFTLTVKVRFDDGCEIEREFAGESPIAVVEVGNDWIRCVCMEPTRGIRIRWEMELQL